MKEDIRLRVAAFRQALEQAAAAFSVDPALAGWPGFIRDFPAGCCELASQTLARYLMEHDEHRVPCVMAMKWIENAQDHGHVIVALDGDYIDLTLDQFRVYGDWIEAEPIESGGQMTTFIRHVRSKGGSITMRELNFDGIPDESEKLYAWLKAAADRLLPVTAETTFPSLVSMDILPQYRDRADKQ